MTKEQIAELARQSGFWIEWCKHEKIQRFAELVAAKAVDEYLDAEREAELKARGEA